MAQSNTVFSGQLYANMQRLYLDFWVVSQDVSSNQTTFGYKAFIKGDYGASGSTYQGAYTLSNAYSRSESGKYWSWSDSVAQTITEGTFTKDHETDGTLANQTLKIDVSMYFNGGNNTASTSVTIPVTTIPRATTPTVGNGAMGTALTINTPRASTSFTHALYYKFAGETSYTIIASGVTTSQSWTPPLSLASKIPNATSGTCNILCETYNGATLIGSKVVNITLSVPTSVVPTISNISVTEGNPGTVPSSQFSVMVKDRSKARVITSAAGAYGSAITSFVVSVNSKNYYGQDITSDTLNVSGSYPTGVSVTVTDSRGRTSISTAAITIVDYFTPTIATFSAVRSTGSTPDDAGVNARVTMKFDVAPVSNQNTKAWYLEYWNGSSWVEITSGSVYSYDATYTATTTFNTEQAHQLRLRVGDYFTESTAYLTLPTAFAIMDIRSTGKGLSVGKVSEKDAFEVAMSAEFSGGLTTQGGGNVAPSAIMTYAPDGYLVDICPVVLSNMITVEVVGNGYGDKPINSIFQTYLYDSDSNFIYTKQSNFGAILGTGVFLNVDGRIKLWFTASAYYQQVVVRAYNNLTGVLKPTIVNSTLPVTTKKATCTVTPPPATATTASLMFASGGIAIPQTSYDLAIACDCGAGLSEAHVTVQIGENASDSRSDQKFFIQPHLSIGYLAIPTSTGISTVGYYVSGTTIKFFRPTAGSAVVYVKKIWYTENWFG